MARILGGTSLRTEPLRDGWQFAETAQAVAIDVRDFVPEDSLRALNAFAPSKVLLRSPPPS